jgi:flagellin
MSRINTNIPSLQAQNNLRQNNSDLQLRLERLSTGLRINRGRDDPAGLIASEVLRSEIRGISQSIDNSQRAINVISTAEGSLNEVSSLLLEVRGLINKSANTGAISTSEIQANQLQIDSLLESIDRIANTTQFGGEKLINGNFQYTVSGQNVAHIAQSTIFGARVPDNASRTVVVQVTNSAETAGVTFAGSAISGNVTLQIQGNLGAETFSFASGTSIASVATTINSFSTLTGVSANVNGAGSALTINSQAFGSDAFVSVKPVTGNFIVAPGNESRDNGVDAGVLINGQSAAVNGLRAQVRSSGLDVQFDLSQAFGTSQTTTSFEITGGGGTFQIGPEVVAPGQLSIGIPSVATSNLGTSTLGYLNTLGSGRANSIVGRNFTKAEQIVKESIEQIAIIRGRLGGIQRNQLETNIRSQGVSLENVSAAESAIRDADIAEEVSKLTRAQILVQSSTNILGLANQLPQSVLSLLG